MLGAIEAQGPGGRIAKWPSRAVAALLARLALGPQRAHSREELVELLWPGVALEVGRNRLRQVLSTLKSLLEGGADAHAVIDADRSTVRVVAGALACDALAFERALRSGHAERARELYLGELMPGHYDDWVVDERRRLATLYERLDALPALPAPAVAAPSIAPSAPSPLPSYWTQLYGVELVASRLRALAAMQRLVTVCGPGGCGKTRLAVEVAQALRDAPQWPIDGDETRSRFDRVVFVPLVDCTDADQAFEAIAAALRISGARSLARVAEVLGSQRSLLVLDNFEQLVAHGRDVVEPLLTRSSGLHLLVTSRQRLAVPGEQLFELEGLALPDADATDDGLANPAVALFVDRARAGRPDFQPGPRDAEPLRELVRLLDGMPLAIELAASRIRRHSPRELLRRLRGDAGATPMLDVLSHTHAGTLPPGRHDSMRRVVEWSWRQLTPVTIAMMEALVPFASPARAEAVAAVAGCDFETTVARLELLRDASLVQARQDDRGIPRYVLLQPVREFAAERLDAADALQARRRLRRWLVEHAGASAAQGPHEIAAELAHVIAMIASAPADDDARAGIELAVALAKYVEIDTSEPLPLSAMLAIEQALPAVAGDAALFSQASQLLAFSRGVSGFAAEAQRHAEAAVACAPDARLRGRALSRLAWIGVLSNRPDARVDAMLEESLKLAQAAGDLIGEATALRMTSAVAINFRLEFVSSEQRALRAQRIWEQLGDRRNAYRRMLDRATCWAWTGRNDEAATALAACERAAMGEGDFTGTYMAAWQLGRVHIRLRNWNDALDAFRRCIAISWARNHMLGVSYGLLHMADAQVMLGQAETGARLFGFAIPHWERQFGTINRIEAREARRTRRLLRLALGGPEAEALRIAGQGMSLADAVALALPNA